MIWKYRQWTNSKPFFVLDFQHWRKKLLGQKCLRCSPSPQVGWAPVSLRHIAVAMAKIIQLPLSPGLILLLRFFQTIINQVEFNQRTQHHMLVLNILAALSPLTQLPQSSLDLVGYHVSIKPGMILCELLIRRGVWGNTLRKLMYELRSFNIQIFSRRVF